MKLETKNNLNLAPICLFVYRRPWHTLKTIDALQNNYLADKSDLIIFSDGFKDNESEKKVREVRDYICRISGFKSVRVVESPYNKGLAKSIVDGVSLIIKQYGKVIVLEDDLITSKNFLDYMNKCLDFYESNKRVLSISGHSYANSFYPNYEFDVAFGYRASSWGWATWGNRWMEVDWEVKTYKSFRFNIKKRLIFNKGGSDLSHMLDRQMSGKINSWAIRFCYHQYLYNMVDVFPKLSKVKNIGYSVDSENCDVALIDDELDMSNNRNFILNDYVYIDDLIARKYRKNFNYYIRLKRNLIRLKIKIFK